MKLALILSAALVAGNLALAEPPAGDNADKPKREHAGKGPMDITKTPGIDKLLEKIKGSTLTDAEKSTLTTFLEAKKQEMIAFRTKTQGENKAFFDTLKADTTKTEAQKKEAVKAQKEETRKALETFHQTTMQEIRAKLQSTLGDRATGFMPKDGEGKGPNGKHGKGNKDAGQPGN